ncbi:MAG: type III-A CRISPR-associated RAMP protein Csm3 [Candidatus Competibacter sp.]|nr:type III-A CRISPR-associated RAMP protein Csm3 [Candidatus Competibacteraceae bacterium]MBL8253002.1 type III-A CRISPR-associated RAMP protein Csm3 [Candidatus Competibacter sp.]
MTHSLVSTHRITATLVLRSGLHIGAGKDAIEIGGLDLPVVKQPFTQEPYIPGSSLKGKLRSLLEWALNRVENDGGVWGSEKKGQYADDDPILRAFGTTHKQWRGGPTRLLVRDAYLERVWADSVRDQGLAFTEEKMEVSIDRIQGKAKDGGLRRIERVPAGARFELDMGFKVFDWNGDGGKTDLDCLNRVLEGLKLLERDALGGSGSRGYGRVRVENLKVDERDVQAGFDAIVRLDPEKPAALAGV